MAESKVNLTDDGWVICLPGIEYYRMTDVGIIVGTTISTLKHYIRHNGLKETVLKSKAGRNKMMNVVAHVDLCAWMEQRRANPTLREVYKKFATYHEDEGVWIFTMPIKSYYSATEAARILGVSTSRIYTWRRTGAMKFVRIVPKGGTRRLGSLHVEHEEFLNYVLWRESKKSGFNSGTPGGFEIVVDK